MGKVLNTFALAREILFMAVKSIGWAVYALFFLSLFAQASEYGEAIEIDAILSAPIQLSHSASAQPFVVVSDYDDTVKVTHVLHSRDAVTSGFFGNDTFVGMSALFNAWQLSAQSMVYLSGSPQFMAARITNTLAINKFPPGILILSNWLHKWTKWENVYTFKLNALMLERTKQNAAFLLIGDDTQSDAQVFLEYRKSNPDIQDNMPIYIHRVTGKALPQGVIAFWTAFEVALNEFAEGRLNAQQTIEVGEAILRSDRYDLLFPNFIECPTNLTFALSSDAQHIPELMTLSKKLELKISNYCWDNSKYIL
ncbi:MAG: phosphatase domain-containing protein [Bdellovibrionia bacterium]